jgi:hypothetical protein
MFTKIKAILYNNELCPEDKLIEIQQLLPKDNIEVGEIFGQPCTITRKGNDIIYNGAHGEYTNTPRLVNPGDIYYTGYGCTWGIDLDDRRYWKTYHPGITKNGYRHLALGDIVNEKARIQAIVREYLNEM